ncbi:hypothetical protein [Marinobacter sp. F4216]|uniref:hypothetical protein n=1 Tax=Marinobacter sp. F4216 TaxID=2874281 RepID=UPI001CBF728F|nr:hypothetical protein [Marinobacter sp. F4216]MBZ2168624.1 hypothetical protein [Marinobacter sp. F4216]
MKPTNATARIRKPLICALTAVILAAPVLGHARWGGGLSSRIETVKSNTSTLITNVREKAPIQSIAEKVQNGSPDIFADIKDMNVLDQLKQTMGMIRQMQTEYEYFTGGSGCSAICAGFRSRIKYILNDFLNLASEIPALSSRQDLLENLQRMSVVIDYVPPRPLYLMWQTVGAQMQQLESTVSDIRQMLASLPPLLEPARYGFQAVSSGNLNRAPSGEVCEWAVEESEPKFELIRESLNMSAWVLKKSADLIPDVSIEAEGGASAGAGVANATASATVGVKPTDVLKSLLKLIAWVPEGTSWTIKMNILYAKAICT